MLTKFRHTHKRGELELERESTRDGRQCESVREREGGERDGEREEEIEKEKRKRRRGEEEEEMKKESRRWRGQWQYIVDVN